MTNNATGEQLIAQIFATKRLLQERATLQHGQFDPATHLRIETLRYIKERGSPSMREVAQHLWITPPSATSLINGLVKSGHIQRVQDSKDRRIIHLSLTAKGRTMLSQGLARITEHIRKLFSKLDQDEQQQLTGILKKLSQ